MIGLIAGKTVDFLKIGQENRKNVASAGGENSDSDTDVDTEIFKLISSNRKVKIDQKQMMKNLDTVNFGVRCRAFIAFLVMITFVGVVMLVSLAALGEFKDDGELANFKPITQAKGLKNDAPVQINSLYIESFRGNRLPRSLSPQRYFLSISVDIPNAFYAGIVNITLLCKKESDKIVLHSTKHEITEVWVTAPQSQTGMSSASWTSI